ncbi:unnamed protein product [Orchesella dallaii]|uniref:Uncharacterized protein n=1 Tax=Orchesella dallaii TaxID=48710 RepID=A0ABP1QAL8_9HEXA
MKESKEKMKTTFSFGNRGNEAFKTCPEQCLPACNETFYNYVVSAAQFPNQKDPNLIRLLRQGIENGYGVLTSIDYVR